MACLLLTSRRWGMLTVETIGRIRRERLLKGKSIKEIARDLKVSRNTALQFNFLRLRFDSDLGQTQLFRCHLGAGVR